VIAEPLHPHSVWNTLNLASVCLHVRSVMRFTASLFVATLILTSARAMEPAYKVGVSSVVITPGEYI
jgi:hypothetical protein